MAEVLYASFVEYEPLYTRQGFAATTPTAEQILARMREGPAWVSVRQTEVVGTVAAVLKGQSVYMRGMAVLPAARGLQVGTRLIECVEDWALDLGYRRLLLSTTPFLNRAIRLYERCGFRRTDNGPRDLFGTPLFTMEKTVLR